MNVNWLFNKCGRYEVDLSLFAADVLEKAKATEVKAHLGKCPTCRAQFADLQGLAHALSRQGNDLSKVETPASLRKRWTAAVRESTDQEQARGWMDWLSGRKLAWGTIGAMWALVVLFRFSAPEGPTPAVVASAPSLREVLMALKVDKPEGESPRADGKNKNSTPEALPPHSQKHLSIHTA
jgi:anti-sigma factor RsiW